jgi:hypothetical protein
MEAVSASAQTCDLTDVSRLQNRGALAWKTVVLPGFARGAVSVDDVVESFLLERDHEYAEGLTDLRTEVPGRPPPASAHVSGPRCGLEVRSVRWRLDAARRNYEGRACRKTSVTVEEPAVLYLVAGRHRNVHQSPAYSDWHGLRSRRR